MLLQSNPLTKHRRDELIEKLTAIIKEKNVEIQTLRVEIETLYKQLAEKNAELEKLKREIRELTDENENLKRAIEEAKTLYERLTIELEELKRLYAEKCEELKAIMEELNGLRMINGELTARTSEIKPEVEKLKKLIADLKIEYETLLKEVGKLEKSNDKLIKEIEDLKIFYNELVGKYNALNQSNGDLESENEKLRVSVEEYINIYEKLKSDNEKHAEEIRYYKERGGSEDGFMQRDNKMIFESNRELRDSNKELRLINERLLAEAELWNDRVMELRQQLEDFLADQREENLEKRDRREGQAIALELMKQSLASFKKDINELDNTPVTMFTGKQKSKTTQKIEQSKTTQKIEHYHPTAHYVTHPCTACKPELGIICPLHLAAMGIEEMELTLDEAKKLLIGDDQKDKIRALKRILAYAEDEDDAFKERMENYFGDLNIMTIVRNDDWERTVLRLLDYFNEEIILPTFEVAKEQGPSANLLSFEAELAAEEEKEFGVFSPVADTRSPMCSLAFSPTGTSPIVSPSGSDSLVAFSEEMMTELMPEIKQVIESKQTEDIKEFKATSVTGKSNWCNTHFIFMLDCSGSMKGSRWDAVTTGFDICLQKIKRMENVFVSAFTFDTKVNPFCRERHPTRAIAHSKKIPFTGKGTNYKRPIEYAITLMEKSENPGYLTCLMFLSDGLGGYPKESMNALKRLRSKGRKMIFYTIACETEEEADMMQMSTEMEGEHYKITSAEASKIVFAAILNV